MTTNTTSKIRKKPFLRKKSNLCNKKGPFGQFVYKKRSSSKKVVQRLILSGFTYILDLNLQPLSPFDQMSQVGTTWYKLSLNGSKRYKKVQKGTVFRIG